MSDTAALDTWLDPLIAALSNGQRAALSSRIARELKASQTRRIKANLNPDGSAYAPRLPQGRRVVGRIKRGAMFRKLAARLKSTSSADGCAVTIVGRTARIAIVHQEGLTDMVKPGGPTHRYARRILLGFSDADREMIESLVVQHFAGAVQ